MADDSQLEGLLEPHYSVMKDGFHSAQFVTIRQGANVLPASRSFVQHRPCRLKRSQHAVQTPRRDPGSRLAFCCHPVGVCISLSAMKRSDAHPAPQLSSRHLDRSEAQWRDPPHCALRDGAKRRTAHLSVPTPSRPKSERSGRRTAEIATPQPPRTTRHLPSPAPPSKLNQSPIHPAV